MFSMNKLAGLAAETYSSDPERVCVMGPEKPTATSNPAPQR